MRNIQILLITLFLLVTVAFGLTFAYNTYVADTTPPVLTSDSDSLEVNVNATDEALCAGLSAYDNEDGDLTSRIRVKSVSQLIGSNSAQVTYVVFDNASNAATLTRTIYYSDYKKPHYSLSQPLIYGISQTVTLLDRLSAYDVVDGDLSSKIRLTMVNLITSVAGSYQIRVIVSNSLGDTAMLPLTVTIRNTPIGSPTIKLSTYLVYTEVNQPLSLPDYIESVKDPTADAARIDKSNVRIISDINYTQAGVYDVHYTYTGTTGLDYDVILTVVVE